MVEKPLAVSVRAGRLLVDLAAQRELSLGVMEVVRYDESIRCARGLIDRGELGEIQMAASVSIGTREWSPDRVVADTPWRHRKLEAGGGASIDLGVHVVHELRYLVGEIDSLSAIARVFEPERVLRDDAGNALGAHPADVDDAFFAVLGFTGGAAGIMSFTWAGHGEPTSLPGGLTLYGTHGCLKGSTFIGDDGRRADAGELFRQRENSDLRERYFPRGVTDPFALAYDDWLNAIRAGGQPETSGLEGLRDLATAFAIPESSLARTAVAIEDVLSGAVDAYQREINAHHGL